MFGKFMLACSLAAIFAAGSAWAQSREQDAARADAEDETVQLVVRRSAPVQSPFAGSENAEIIISTTGDVVAPWVRSQGCSANRCGEMIANAETGEIAAFDGEWMGGFVVTGYGDEVVRIITGTTTN